MGRSSGSGQADQKVHPEVEDLVVWMARANPGWAYDRIVGALANLGHRISDHRWQ